MYLMGSWNEENTSQQRCSSLVLLTSRSDAVPSMFFDVFYTETAKSESIHAVLLVVKSAECLWKRIRNRP